MSKSAGSFSSSATAAPAVVVAVENGKAEAWGAGVERKRVMTVGTVELRAEVLKEVERRRRYATRNIASIAKIGLTRMLEEYRKNVGCRQSEWWR
jgi:hypothetical protein